MNEPTALTFETGYDRLQSISQRVTSEDVTVSEMCELFAEGKGLQKALTEYLDQQKSRVEAIERGEGIQAFRIEAPSTPTDSDDDDIAWDTTPTVTNGASADDVPVAGSRPSLSAGASDDDIPF
jgi:exodeoxyribonuclease VII small subunit